MTRRLVVPALLLLIAVGLAMLPETAAITRTMDRPPGAKMGPDPNAALSLVSFANTAFTMNGSTFSGAGSVKNNFNVPMTVTVTATPAIVQSCQSVDGTGLCTGAAWSLALCIATDQTSLGAKNCKGGQADQLIWSGSGTGTASTQSFKSISASAGQTIYLFVKGAPSTRAAPTSRLCATAVFDLAGSATGKSVQLNANGNTGRSQIYRNGSGCQ